MVAAIAAMALFSPTADAQLVINELMQSNVTGYVDELNDFPDSWVELYNSGEETEQLSDYHIGLKKKIDKADALPAQEILPGEYVLILCDKAETGLHTSFRLESNKAGDVYLFKNGVQVDHVAHPAFPAPDIAYGLDPESGEWGYEFTATPGAANVSGICDESMILPSPIFSQPGRVGTEPLSLAITVPDGAPEGTVVRYTLDGSLPTAESTVLDPNEELVIDGTKLVRARLFCDGWLSPFPVTQSYIFPDHDITLPVISIVTDEDYFYTDDMGILSDVLYVDGKANCEHDWRRPINIEFFFDYGSSAINQLCETRVAGGSSRQHPLKTLAIYANKRFGEKRFSYEFFPDQKPGLDNFKSLMLRNGGNDFYHLYLRDPAAQLNMATNTDLDWQAYRPAVAFINGKYAGILNIRERSNDDNVFSNYNELEDIHMFENWGELKAGDRSSAEEFRKFYSAKDHTLDDYNQVMDVEEFTNLMLMNIFYNNLDFPCNNIVMWRPVEDGGKWRWIAKDADMIMGIYSVIKSDYQIFNWYYDNKFHSHYNWGNQSYGTKLFLSLLDNPDYFKMFIDRALAYLGDFMNYRGTVKSMDYCYNQIREEYPYHSAIYITKPVGNNRVLSPEDFDEEYRQTKDWVSARHEFFYDHLAEFFNLGAPAAMVINQPESQTRSDEQLVELELNGIKINNPTFDGKYFKDHKMVVSAKCLNENNAVVGWTVRSVGNDGVEENIINSAVLEMAMPECSMLEITPVITGDVTGIGDVSTDSNEGFATEYYDLNGRRISPSGMRPGVYVVKKGDKVTKRVISGN